MKEPRVVKVETLKSLTLLKKKTKTKKAQKKPTVRKCF